MRSDDLSSLFTPNPIGPALPAAFRQAQLLAFDADDGSNTVQIGTSTIDDLPLLVTGAEIGLSAGDTVVVMYLGNTPMIVGKIASVGGPNYGASSTGHARFLDNLNGFGISSSGSILITDSTVTVPSWAHSAQLVAFGSAYIFNGAGVDCDFYVQFLWSDSAGNSGHSATIQGPSVAGKRNPAYAQYAELIPVGPGATLTFQLKALTSVTQPNDVNAFAGMTGYLEFYRESVPS
jgi:hypothetical protein